MRESKKSFGQDEEEDLDDLRGVQPKTDVPSAPNRDIGPHGTKEVDDVPDGGEVPIEPPD
ncbi:hypothetical protein ACFWIW_14505 [Amycolatopsis sp. NPDC058340]|uniref:hypothetical protein n=1 Tax=Amycolatopsis sp. NPDC058340 TaxID=3346453 RepID=UPI003666F249